MNLPQDFKDLLEEFGRDGVEALLIGGYAVAFHGRPRATKDIDILLEGSAANLARAARALGRFGAPPNVVAAVTSMRDDDVVYMGQPPLRIDFLRTIDGVAPHELFAAGENATIDGLSVRVISLEHLIENKRASGRPQDRLDADYLEKVRARRNGGDTG